MIDLARPGLRLILTGRRLAGWLLADWL